MKVATDLLGKLVTVYTREDKGSVVVTGYVRVVATNADGQLRFLIEVADKSHGRYSFGGGGPGDLMEIVFDYHVTISRTMHPWPYDGPDGTRTDQPSVNPYDGVVKP